MAPALVLGLSVQQWPTTRCSDLGARGACSVHSAQTPSDQPYKHAHLLAADLRAADLAAQRIRGHLACGREAGTGRTASRTAGEQGSRAGAACTACLSTLQRPERTCVQGAAHCKRLTACALPCTRISAHLQADQHGPRTAGIARPLGVRARLVGFGGIDAEEADPGAAWQRQRVAISDAGWHPSEHWPSALQGAQERGGQRGGHEALTKGSTPRVLASGRAQLGCVNRTSASAR